MVTQYPYYLFRKVATSTVDADGNYTSTGESWVLIGRCRDEKANCGVRIDVGGQQYTAEHVIYAPLGVLVRSGAEVVVAADAARSVERLHCVVRLCQVNQLHVRIYG